MSRRKPLSPEAMTDAELRAEITQLQGSQCDSTSHAYLVSRLASLRRVAQDGGLVHERTREKWTNISVSLPVSSIDTLSRIVSERKLRSRSQLVQVALVEWCKRNGYPDEAADFAREE
jgi:hypothetical protein